jgi:IS30 family transposase
VDAQLRHNWSPQQIAGWLKSIHPEDEALRVSHETIYRTLFVQTRGVLKKELIEHLRLHHPIRRSRHATAKADTRGCIPDTVSISERPASVEDRAIPGHWEGDLLCGSKNSYIERFTMATDIQVYFCDPQSPWQRGSNENTNRLLRQYFPKKTDLSVHSQARLNYVARELNERPRETLGFKTPKEKFQACVASTT